MSSAKITLFNFAEWMNANEEDLFSEMTLPEGIDKNTLTDNILMRGGEFEVLYSDPDFFKYGIGVWSKKWYRTFLKWITALNIEYNPLENYDRMEDWTDTGNRGLSVTGRKDSGNTRTFNNQDKRTLDTENKRTLDTENKRTLDTEDKETIDTTQGSERTVSAYDSSTYQPAEKNVTDNDGTDTFTHTGTDTMNNTGTDTMNNTGTDTVDYSGTIKDEYGEGYSSQDKENSKNVHNGRIHGNIGVTTSQMMLESELSLAEWNIYEHITDLFLSEFVIPIYS